MQCPLLMLQVVGKPCRGGKAMNEPSANPVFMVLLFVLRCIVPLAILFGISYLLRRMGLVAIESPEPKEEKEEVLEKSAKAASPPKLTSVTQPKKQQKREVKAASSRKKPVGKKTATKTKTGNPRSRSK
jgi:hypothetical protein